jgi:hypothetical protein
VTRGRLLVLPFLAAAILGHACGGSSPPAAPSSRYSINGTVFAAGTQSGIAGARVDIVSGANAGRSVTADGSGRYTFADLEGGPLTLRASAAGYAPAEQAVVLGADQTVNLSIAAAEFFTNGRVVDALTAAGLGGVAMAGSGLSALPSGATGSFVIVGASGSSDPVSIAFSGSGLVERHTQLRVPGPDALISLIPTSFDLRAFDEMFRVPQLLRWTDAPPLAIERRTLQFTSLSDVDFTALAESLTDGEVEDLSTDLTWALPQLTGNSFGAFASRSVQQAGEGSRVRFLTGGRITIARFAGLTAATSFWGYSRWQYRSDGAMTGGTIMLDRDFEKSGSPFRRSLRAHELGHALGCNHVTARVSVMNSNARTEPNDFDRSAGRLAFQRPPGNRSPDTDPDPYSVNRLLVPTWSVGAR